MNSHTVRHRRKWGWLAAGVLAVASVAATTGTALASSPSGTVTETINVGVRSLTVSPTSVNMCSSAAPLTFPNGSCSSPIITITEGQAGGHIDVNGANASPADNAGNSWGLCGGAGIACTGGSGGASLIPGQDQYVEITDFANTNGTTNLGSILTATLQCDSGFDTGASGCSASPNQASTEQVAFVGPSTSTDQSPTFTTSVTWTAAP